MTRPCRLGHLLGGHLPVVELSTPTGTREDHEHALTHDPNPLQHTQRSPLRRLCTVPVKRPEPNPPKEPEKHQRTHPGNRNSHVITEGGARSYQRCEWERKLPFVWAPPSRSPALEKNRLQEGSTQEAETLTSHRRGTRSESRKEKPSPLVADWEQSVTEP